jgi:hypothetical protein
MYMSEPVWGSRIHSDLELFGHIGSGFGITVPDHNQDQAFQNVSICLFITYIFT